jgi:proline iminopeptidase
MCRFFNPIKFRIVLHTQLLVQDIERLRQHPNLDKIVLFGGSWGSTLALDYGQTYPEHVSAIILRGVFTATQEEIDHFYQGGVRTFFP